MSEAGQVAAQRRGVMLGIAAAALFGCSPPIAKLLLPRVGLLPLSGLLYLGAGLALTLARIVRRASGGPSREAPLRPRDWSLLFAVVVFGGALGPILMLVGLSRLSALAASLLLNLEVPFTIAIAVLFFREHLGTRQTLGAGGIILGATLLGQQPGGFSGDWRGTFAVAAACLCWAIDNNLSQRLSLRDPVAVVQVKGLGAGACVLLIALATRAPFPSAALIAAALLVGAFSYGLSLVLNMQALRVLGAARQAAIFATAPFIGAVLSVPLLGDRPNLLTFLAGVLMITGVTALILERHRHLHRHEPLEHEHLHVHDEHHQHQHPEPVTEPHSHPHVHAPLVHDHPHVPDLHHRHPHR